MGLYEQQNDNQIRTICGIIMAVILIVMCLFIFGKEGYHRDEILSYELANSEAGAGYLWEHLSSEKVWVSGQNVKESLTVTHSDFWNYASAASASSVEPNPPLYRLALHLASSLFIGYLSPLQGCLINLLFLFGILYILMKICEDVFGRLSLAPYCLALYGFSVGAISGVIAIRMYMMVSFFIMWVLYQHLMCWKKNRFRYHNLYLIFAIMGGMLTQYYFAAYFYSLVVIVSVALLLRKRYKDFWGYLRTVTIASVASGIGILLPLLDMWGGKETVEAFYRFLYAVNWKVDVWQSILLYLEHAFGNIYTGFLLVGVLIISALWAIFKRKMKVDRMEAMNLLLMFIPLFVYLLFATTAATSYSDRYMVGTLPIMVLAFIWGIDGSLRRIKLRDLRRKWILSIAVVMVIVPGIVFAEHEFLFTGYAQQIDIAKQHEEYPCVLVTDDIYHNVAELVYYSETMAVTENQLYKLNRDETLQSRTGFVLIIAKKYDPFYIIDFLMDTYGFNYEDTLITGMHGERYYFISRNAGR